MQVIRLTGSIESDGHIRMDLPTSLSPCDAEIVIVIHPVPSNGEKHKYDFSDLVGRLEWQGDPVAEQRKLRDEW